MEILSDAVLDERGECGYMQGFSYCRPLEPERIGELLRGRLPERQD